MLRTLGGSLSILALLAAPAGSTQAPSPGGRHPATLLAVGADRGADLRALDARTSQWIAAGRLALRRVDPDPREPAWSYERYDEVFHGVRVFGGDLVRQTRNGITEAVFGTLHDDVAIGTAPGLSADAAREVFGRLGGTEMPPDRAVELVILPTDGGYALAWSTHIWSGGQWLRTFVDASTGATLLQYDDRKTQSAVGTGTGVNGERKKLSTREAGGRFWADDLLRPPVLSTFDASGDLNRAKRWLYTGPFPGSGDMASDDDNTWTDGATVDAHAYLGWTYDYYYTRFGRQGLDGQNAPIRALTHPVNRSDIFYASNDDLEYYLNAFWCEGCGPGAQGMMVFGEGLPEGYVLSATGQSVTYFSAGLDVVAHELTHGVTDHTSRLEYRFESGALNESFSDIMGTSVEFFYQPAGSGLDKADYLIGEDIITPGGIRSMANPGQFGDPDHYSKRYQGSDQGLLVHTNSGIPNHAFYLAIEGGTNRTSGLHVTGVGAANREQIEQAFYRAFVFLLPSEATFHTARVATIQAARDLYGAGSGPETAITQAWTAVGVN